MEFPKRIVFTGPESSGKTFLAKAVSEKYGYFLVDEYARTYLLQFGQNYDLNDLQKIEKGQRDEEQRAIEISKDIIIQDTDFLTIWIWYFFKYKLYPNRVYKYLQNHIPEHYILCRPDIPWERDDLRENPDDRELLYHFYREEINKLGASYTVIQGSYKERIEQTFSIIEDLH